MPSFLMAVTSAKSAALRVRACVLNKPHASPVARCLVNRFGVRNCDEPRFTRAQRIPTAGVSGDRATTLQTDAAPAD